MALDGEIYMTESQPTLDEMESVSPGAAREGLSNATTCQPASVWLNDPGVKRTHAVCGRSPPRPSLVAKRLCSA
jgi:hypothetical protein